MTFRSQPKRPTETETETETKTDTITDTDTRLLSDRRFVTKEQAYVVGNNASVPSQSLVINSLNGKMARSFIIFGLKYSGQIPLIERERERNKKP